MADCKIKNKNVSKSNSLSRYRELLRIMLRSIPEISIIEESNEDGDVVFSVNMEDMGISAADYVNYKPEIFSNYIVDTIAELLVRENLNAFAGILMKMDTDSYTNLIGKYEHRRFGMRIVKNNFVFRFHISLLQNLLTEDLKKRVK